MIKDSIIYPVNQSEWASLMVVQTKKHKPKNLRVCVDFIWLNKLTLTNLFPTLFANEIIDEVVGHKCYSFTE